MKLVPYNPARTLCMGKVQGGPLRDQCPTGKGKVVFYALWPEWPEILGLRMNRLTAPAVQRIRESL